MPDMNSGEPPETDHGSSRRRSRIIAPAVVRSGREAISVELALTIFRQMVRTRALEEQIGRAHV